MNSTSLEPGAPPPGRLRFRAEQPPRSRSDVAKLHPGIRPDIIDPLATIWDEVVHEIVCAMMDLAAADQTPLHINLREEMILQLAQLQLFLQEKVVEKRLGGRDPATIDPAEERAACFDEAGQAAIRETARNAYEGVWRRRMEKRWKPKSAAAIARDANPKERLPAIKRVEKNHFISRWLIRDHWAFDGKVTRWRRGAGGWTAARRSFGKWGYRHKLYSDRLEAYLGMIEGDAKRPIEMLMATRPLNGPERISLVAFLVIQILRSPFFIARLQDELWSVIAELGLGDDPDLPAKAYEALYRNDEFYNKLAHPVMWSRWALVRAPAPIFVLPDTFGARSELGDGLRLIAPLTPRLCFVTLPARETEKRIVPLHLAADEALSRRIAGLLVASAADEFLSHPDFRPDGLPEGMALGQVLADIEAAIG